LILLLHDERSLAAERDNVGHDPFVRTTSRRFRERMLCILSTDYYGRLQECLSVPKFVSEVGDSAKRARCRMHGAS